MKFISVNRITNLPLWFQIALVAVFLVFLLLVGVVTFSIARSIVANSPIDVAQNGPDVVDDTAGQTSLDDVDPSFTATRITVLVLGIDERQVEFGPWRTDTMILLTVEPNTNTAGMVSIPRDLWVEIPNYGYYERINTAHFLGDLDQYPGGGGPALAMETVQYNLGIPVNYYLSVNFNAFVNGIDQIGCIPIDVPQTIDDPLYPDGAYGYDPFRIEEGEHCLDGNNLLKYARTRATPGGDFDRAQRQQQVIYAMRDHVLSTEQFPSLVAQSPELYRTVEDGVNTNLSLGQMVELSRIATNVPDENICSAVLSGEFTDPQRIEDSDVLIPNKTAIRSLMSDVFTGTGRCASIDPETRAQVEDEAATIGVLNGTDRDGLATEAANVLRAVDVDVDFVGNARQFAAEDTYIYNYNEKDVTARYVARLLGIPEDNIQTSGGPGDDYDIQIVLGLDFHG